MLALANDYCVDGCWEPILNGKSDWTFTMPNAMTALESALNSGASLSPDEELFRGAKVSPATPLPRNFEELMAAFKTHLAFFTDQCVLSMFLYYMIDESAAPSPLLSAYLEGCMKKGRDKASAGADYNLGGVIYGGIPNVINTLAALNRWVFPANGQGKYSLEQIVDALRHNFWVRDDDQELSEQEKLLQKLYLDIKTDFNTNTEKFGNNDPEINALTRRVLDICYEVVEESAKFAKKVYQDEPQGRYWKNIIALRRLTGYYGLSLSRKYGQFAMKITVGMGTFEQYNWQGRGIAACADRGSGEPLAPNFSPMPGTLHSGVSSLLASFQNLGLDRFAGGVITDICLESKEVGDAGVLAALLKQALDKNAPMLTFSLGSQDYYPEIREACLEASKTDDKIRAAELLAPHANVIVRIGGWQTPFITLPISHMDSYIQRPAATGL